MKSRCETVSEFTITFISLFMNSLIVWLRTIMAPFIPLSFESLGNSPCIAIRASMQAAGYRRLCIISPFNLGFIHPHHPPCMAFPRRYMSRILGNTPFRFPSAYHQSISIGSRTPSTPIHHLHFRSTLPPSYASSFGGFGAGIQAPIS